MSSLLHWSERDLQYLRHHYQTSSFNAMARALGMHPMKVLRRCQSLGLICTEASSKPQPWTPEMEEYLRQHWSVKSGEEIAAYLQKPKSSVFTKACRMGLKRTPEDHKTIGLSDGAISDQFALDVLGRKRPALKARMQHYPELIQAEKLRIQLNRYINHVRRQN